MPVILIADRGFYGGMMHSLASSDMQKLRYRHRCCRVINVGKQRSESSRMRAFNQIQDELRTQYLASYTPTNAKADGTYRKIDLACGKGLKVQTRKGYYAISSTDTQ